MKKITTLLFLISFNLQASNYMAKSEILNHGVQAFTFKEDCEKVKSQKCIDIGNYPSSVFSEIDVLVDDLTRPKYSKNEVYDCESLTECELAHMTKTCDIPGEESILNTDLMQVYCSRHIGYEKKTEKEVMVDPIKVSAWENQKTIEAQEAALNRSIDLAMKKIECGKRVIGLLVIRNATKGLNTAQIAQMTGTYSTIKNLLETGSLVTAKEQILETVADGVLITESDKTALANETQKCIDL